MALDVGRTPTPGTTGSSPLPFNALPLDGAGGGGDDVVPPPESLTPETSESHVSDPRVEAEEAEARGHGWVSQEEWEADGRAPDRWKPAAEFLDVRRNIQSVLRQENSDLRAKVAAMELRERQRDQKTAEAQTTLTLNDIKFQMREAQENGDWAKYTDLNEKLLDAKLAATKAAPAASDAPALDAQSKAEALAFREANPWLLKDRELARNFTLELKALTDIDPQMGAAEALTAAKQRVMRLFPERFRTGNARRPPMYETGGTTPSVNGRGWANLNPLYRAQAEADIAAKRYTKEEFLANCQDDPDAWRR